MALADDLASLDRVFRRRQVATQTAAAVAVSRLFAVLPIDQAVSETSPAVEDWVERSTRLTLIAHDRLATDARTYYDAVARLTSPGYVPQHPDIRPPDDEQIRTSLAVTGVVGLRKRLEKISQPLLPAPLEDEPDRFQAQRDLLAAGTDRLREDAQAKSGDAAGAAVARHVGNGQRHQVQDTVKTDRRAIGYIRVTSGDPCYFCAMLASRGPVYKEDSFEQSDLLFDGEGRHKVHDSCACSMRPVYTRGAAERPGFNIQMEDHWAKLSDDLGYSPSLQEWRSFYDGLRNAA